MAENPQDVRTEQVHTTTHHTHVEDEQKTGLLSNILAIVGFIILVVIIIWGLVHLASLSGGWFSGMFSGKSNRIEVTAPQSATSGNPISVSWKYSTSEKGSYAFLYQCKKDIQLATPANQSSLNLIPCGAAFTVPSTNNTFSIVPLLTGTTSVQVPFSIVFTPSATTSKPVTGSATVTVNPAVNVTGPTTTPPINNGGNTGSNTPNPSTGGSSAPRPAGPADLVVRMISASAGPGGAAIVQFDIANVGGSSSGSYYFIAQLPSSMPYTYTSPIQSPLGPGDHVVSTLNFTQAIPGTVQVIVDPSNAVRESSEMNNMGFLQLSMPYYAPQPYIY